MSDTTCTPRRSRRSMIIFWAAIGVSLGLAGWQLVQIAVR